MKTLLRWFFGLSLLLTGIATVFNPTPLIAGGIALIVAGLFLLPPTFAYITKRSGKTISSPIKYIAVIGLFIFGISSIVSAEDKKQADKKKQEELAYAKLSPAAKDSIKRAAAHRDSLVQILRKDSIAAVTKATRKEKLQAQFSGYDGSHAGVERAIKERMNDPDSYIHVSTRFIDKGDYIAVLTQFRGKNAFNATILKTATAKVDYSGNVLELHIL